MNIELRPGEDVVKEGVANLQRGAETVGGRLWLTDQRLISEAHTLNFQSGAFALERPAIHSVRPDWTRLFGLVPLLPNALVVGLFDGEEHRFTVFGRQDWVAAIKRQ